MGGARDLGPNSLSAASSLQVAASSSAYAVSTRPLHMSARGGLSRISLKASEIPLHDGPAPPLLLTLLAPPLPDAAAAARHGTQGRVEAPTHPPPHPPARPPTHDNACVPINACYVPINACYVPRIRDKCGLVVVSSVQCAGDGCAHDGEEGKAAVAPRTRQSSHKAEMAVAVCCTNTYHHPGLWLGCQQHAPPVRMPAAGTSLPAHAGSTHTAH